MLVRSPPPVLVPLALALAASLCGSAALAAEGARARLAILPITGEGVLVDDLAPIERALREEIVALGRYDVVDRQATLAELVGARGMGLNCAPFEVGCLVRLGLVGEMQLLVVPAAEREGKLVAITLSLVDVELEREVARVASVVDPRALDVSAAELVRDLLLADPATGMLSITASPDGAVVELDGAPRGTTPLRAPIAALVAGEHSLVVKKDGYRSARAIVDVRARDISRYDLRLARLDDTAGAVTYIGEGAPAAAVTTQRAATEPAAAVPDDGGGARADAPLLGSALASALGAAVALGGGIAGFALLRADDGALVPAHERESVELVGQGLLVAAGAGALVSLGSAAFLLVRALDDDA